MEGLKGGQELRSRLTVRMSAFSCFVLFFGAPFDGGSASPFIDEGAGFTRVRALGRVLYLVLWLTSTRSGPSVRRKISAYNVVDVSVGCQVSLQNAALRRVWAVVQWF